MNTSRKEEKLNQSSFPVQIYSIPELKQILSCFQVCTGLSVFLADLEGRRLITLGKAGDYCKEITRQLNGDTECQLELQRSARQAGTLGTAYFYTCHAGVCNIAFPILDRTRQYGVVVAGPFLLEKPDQALVSTVRRRHHLPQDAETPLFACAKKLPVITPVQATQFSNLLAYLVGGYLTGTKELLRTGRERLLQQSKISESIQTYKNLSLERQETYPITLENTLLDRARRADTTGARLALNDLLGFLLLYEAYDLNKLKVRVIELCSLLSRTAIERAGNADTILKLNEKLIGEIIESDDFNKICYTLSENMEIFTRQYISVEQHHYAVTKTISYLSSHYSEAVTLETAAKEIGIHPTYLSALFKKVTGLSFRDYLTSIRIEHAIWLLTSTDYPIMEIAIACGFNDQSYFTRVFKKKTGMTPTQFR